MRLMDNRGKRCLNKEKLTLQPFLWQDEDVKEENEYGALWKHVIYAWGLTQKSEPILLHIENFPISGYFELPLYIGQRRMQWNLGAVTMLVNEILKICATRNGRRSWWGPSQTRYIERQKLYYYQAEIRHPFMFLTFKTMACLRQFAKEVKDPMVIPSFGSIMLHQLEDSISVVRRFWTSANLEVTQWFNVEASSVSDWNRKSCLPGEYKCSWPEIIPIQSDRTTSPKILSFDGEMHAFHHGGMPKSYLINDVVYLLTCVLRQCGDDVKNSKRHILLYGDTYPVKGANIIKYASEEALIYGFCELIQNEDPDVITGYNILKWDWAYIDGRINRLAMEWPEIGRMIGRKPRVTPARKWETRSGGKHNFPTVDIDGRVNIDLYPAIRYSYKLDTYTLGSVSQHFLGKTKREVKADEMFSTYDRYRAARDIMEAQFDNIEDFEELLNVTDQAFDGDVPDNVDPDELSKLFPEPLEVGTRWLMERGFPYAPFIEYHIAKLLMTRLVQYALTDSDLPDELFDKLNSWINQTIMASIMGVSVPDLTARGQQLRCISQMFDISARDGIIMDQREQTKFDFEGAFVCEPKVGLHDNVICLDFSSLYPSIIISHNICLSTCIPKHLYDQIPKEHCHIFRLTNKEITEYKEGELGENGSDDEVEKAVSNRPKRKSVKQKEILEIPSEVILEVRFIKSEIYQGIIPRLVERLVKRRGEVKKQLSDLIALEKNGVKIDQSKKIVLDAVQLALKTSANSFYGFLGVKEGRLPFAEGAMCVTKCGREMIGQVITYINDRYQADLIYGDTDSVMFRIPNLLIDKCVQRGKEIAKEITDELFSNLKSVNLEFEKAMRMLSFCKKKYVAALVEDGKYNFDEKKLLKRGIVLARRDNCKWLRNVYTKVLIPILKGDPIEVSFQLLIQEIIDLLEGKVHPRELSLIREYGGPYSRQANGSVYFLEIFAEKLRRRGIEIEGGDRLEYIIVFDSETQDRKTKVGDRMELLSDYVESQSTDNPMKIDYLHYIQKVLMNAIDQLFEVGHKEFLESFLDNIYYQPNKRTRITVATPVKLITKRLIVHHPDQWSRIVRGMGYWVTTEIERYRPQGIQESSDGSSEQPCSDVAE